MTNTIRNTYRHIASMLAVLGVLALASCSSTSHHESTRIDSIVDYVWAFGQSHPDGFTLDLRTMTEPTEGIAVSYAEAQNSHSREQLHKVVKHALCHDGYVGGWLNTENGLYFFDSTKLFPETSLKEAIEFAKLNEQLSSFILSTHTSIPTNGKVAEIVERDTLRVGTTGDYRPLSFQEEDGTYWGFGIEVAKEMAHRLGVEITFVKTSWPTLSADVTAPEQTFDMAMGGITITEARCATMLMSKGYLANGKTILCRASDSERFKSLNDINKPEVRVMVNPGGLNEKFALENLPFATLIVHPKNEEIPSLIAQGRADIMITEITEAPYYVKNDTTLAAPLLHAPFTRGEIGVLMRQGQDDLLQMVNNLIQEMQADGTLSQLRKKYGLM